MWISNFIVIARACVGNAFFFLSFFCIGLAYRSRSLFSFFLLLVDVLFFLSFVCNAYLGCGGHGCIELRASKTRGTVHYLRG